MELVAVVQMCKATNSPFQLAFRFLLITLGSKFNTWCERVLTAVTLWGPTWGVASKPIKVWFELVKKLARVALTTHDWPIK